jgi:excisionase family DNA binding protein
MKTARELKQVDGEKYLTVEEAAEELGIKSNAIRNYLCAEKLTTYKFKTLTLLRSDEVEGWKQRKRSKH